LPEISSRQSNVRDDSFIASYVIAQHARSPVKRSNLHLAHSVADVDQSAQRHTSCGIFVAIPSDLVRFLGTAELSGVIRGR